MGRDIRQPKHTQGGPNTTKEQAEAAKRVVERAADKEGWTVQERMQVLGSLGLH